DYYCQVYDSGSWIF
nr:immunoglobulin light chain junction region [Macaca mulatta]MOX78700.1 immunoglobulin light chain junction region [Macaca mulatta]MOX79059.1 immunoglobulin light chain junction region [Macaca mulatta]MOX80427.1 immunoglobulin light chain junction region [Macaca mulatta]MOX81688.1 immunoglobulin light chain junction region [Macaca mulatta]